MEYCLITDIGGTKSQMFLFEMDRNDISRRKMLHECRYSTTEFKSVFQLFDKFLSEDICRSHVPTFCNIAIAGSIKNNSVPLLANIKWEPVDGALISRRYNFSACNLINDFEAAGYGLMNLAIQKQLIPLRPGPRPLPDADQKFDDFEPGNRSLLLGFGSGLGVVTVIGANTKDIFKVIPSESGHLSLAPTNQQEWDLLQYLKQRIGVSAKELFSQEHIFCGRGIPFVYEYLLSKNTDKQQASNLSAKEVFEQLHKPENKELKESFLRIMATFIGRGIDSLCKVFLPTGGKLIMGGLVFHLFKEFYDSDAGSFLSALEPTAFGDPEFGEYFKHHIEFYFYPNDTSEFVVEGASNYLYATEFTSAQSKGRRPHHKEGTPFKKPLTLESALQKTDEKRRDESQGRKRDESQTKRRETSLNPKREESVGRKREESSDRKRDESANRSHSSKKVSFELPQNTKPFDDFYPAAVLKTHIMTFTGYINNKGTSNKLFIGKIVSEPIEKFYRRKNAWQEFRGYRLRLLDAEVTLVIPLNIPRLFKNDIILLNDRDTLYYSKENSWYFQTFENTLTDINYTVFDNVCEKYIGDLPLMDPERLPSKTKSQYIPSSLTPPSPEFELGSLLFAKNNGIIQSKVIIMKIVEVIGDAVFRRDKETVEEFTEVKIQAYKYTFNAFIPKWTTVPQIAFYGFFFKENRFAPGHLNTRIFVMDEYSIFDRSPLYDQQIDFEVELHFSPDDLKITPFDSRAKPGQQSSEHVEQKDKPGHFVGDYKKEREGEKRKSGGVEQEAPGVFPPK